MKLISSVAISTLAALAVLAAVFLADSYEREHWHAFEVNKLRVKLNAVGDKLEQSVNAHLHLSRGLAAFVQSHPHFSEEDFDRFAEALVADEPGVRSLQLAPGGVISYVTNRKENGAALGLDLMQNPERRRLIEAAIEQRSFAIEGPISLVQGGIGILARSPVFMTAADGSREYWGVASVLIDPTALFEKSGITDGLPNVDLALCGKNASGKGDALLFGSRDVFENAVVDVPINFASGSWRLSAAWSGVSPAAFPHERLLLWGLGIPLALILGVSLFFMFQRREVLKQAVADATREARNNETRFSDFAGSSADWFWEMDDQLRFTYVSERVTEITGVPAEYHIGKTREELSGSRTDTPKWKAHTETLRRHEPFRNFLYSRPGPDGKQQYFSVSGIPVYEESGEFAGYRGTASEVTERVLAEQKVSEFKTTLDRTIDCIFMYHPDTLKYFYANQGAQSHVGYTLEELSGMSPLDIVPHLEEEEIRRVVSGLIEGPKHAVTFESVHRHKDGSDIPVEIALQYVAPEGEQPRMIVIARDIKERKKHEAALEAARDEAQAANLAKSQFLSNMSHELRTPLHAIMGFGQVLEADPARSLNEQQRDAVGYILRSGEHLLDLINQVLDLAKVESGSLSLEIEPVQIGEVVSDCMNIAETMAEERGLTVKVELPEPSRMPAVLADSTRLRQALLNLLSNAIKYNRDGGSVTIRSDVLQSGDCRISVSDTGRGIPEQLHEQVFTPFSRLGEEGGDTEGTGIGLSITRQIVEQMGGEIGFTSVEGEGSTFWMQLPVAIEPEIIQAGATRNDAPADPPQGLSAPQMAGTILYVEDNPANLKLMEMILGPVHGVELHSETTAELGIDTAQRLRPDLILMDINLPGMSGLEAVQVLRSTTLTSAIPVLAVSANAMPYDIQAAMKIGFNGYITKPFDVDVVLSMIGKELGHGRPGQLSGTANMPAFVDEAANYTPLAPEDVRRLFESVKVLPQDYVSVLRDQANAIPELISRIRTAFGEGDDSGTELAAHTLKTNSGTFGARDLWMQAQNTEELARRGQGAKAADLVERMELQYSHLEPVIDRLLTDIEARCA